MMVSAWIPWAILAAVAAQRISELVLARRNTAALLARGATETGAAHYPFIVAVHTLWLAALVVWAGYAVLLAVKAVRGLTGRQLALLAVCWFILSLGVFAFV